MDLLMELHLEKILIYGSAILLCVIVVAIYLLKQKRESKIVDQKIEEAKETGKKITNKDLDIKTKPWKEDVKSAIQVTFEEVTGVDLTEDEVFAIYNYNSDFAHRPMTSEGENLAALLKISNLAAIMEQK